MSATEIIIDFKFNETARNFAETHGYGGGMHGQCGMYEMREYAENFTVARGMGLIETAGFNELLEGDPGEYFYGHECARIRRKANAEAAMAMFEAIGVECWEWRGFLAFDASSARGCAVAERIGVSLSDYPTLDDMRVSELEWDAARTLVEQEIRLPDGVNADDVMREMSEIPYCAECGISGLEDAMNALGYRECADCEEWVKSALDGALCHDCTDSYAETDCECVSLYVDTLRHNGSFATGNDVREIQRGCESCYAEMYPYGLTA
ncbi:hypothetical protein ACFCY8_11175 [Streptomyces noursei]|uniref:hypothetical protein n=1 Tax=Streptomyces noursei TaxID=1971 RepID=UPI0035D5FD37